MRLRPRVERLEAGNPATNLPEWVTVIWTGTKDDDNLQQARRAAEAAGRNIVVVRCVGPRPD
jgi:hypothetical protein